MFIVQRISCTELHYRRFIVFPVALFTSLSHGRGRSRSMNLGKPNMVGVRKIAEPDVVVVLLGIADAPVAVQVIAGLGFHPLQNRVDSCQLPLAKRYMAGLIAL